MLKKVITIRIPLAAIYAVAGVLLVAVLLWLTNAVPNLRLATVRIDQIETVTAFHHPDRQAVLNPEDTQTLAQLLPKIALTGSPARILMAETYGPQFRIQMKNGDSFEFSCYSQHYIFNGWGYPAKNTELIYRQLYDLYQSTGSRSYFPEERGD